MKSKDIIKSVTFVLLVVSLMWAVDFILVPSGYIRYTLHTVNDENAELGGDYDCLILGASHGHLAVNPFVLDESGYCRNAYNFCIPGASIVDSYYQLLYANEKNDIEKVILELDYQYWSDYPEREFSDRFIYSKMPVSKTKIKYIADNLLDKDFRTVYSNRTAYTFSPTDVKYNLNLKKTKAYWNYEESGMDRRADSGPYLGKGYYKRDNYVGDKGPKDIYEWNEESLTDKNRRYLKKIAKYCQENNIELNCIVTTITPTIVKEGPSDVANEYLKKLCEENDISFIDGNLISKKELPRTDECFADWEGHMNGDFAIEYTRVLARQLKKENVKVYPDYASMKKDF